MTGGADSSGGADALLDADLAGLDAELASAGASARRAHAGQSRPTAAFAGALRGRLISGMAPAIEAETTATWRAHRSPAGDARRPDLIQPGEAWAPVALAPRVAGRIPPPVVASRRRWLLVAAAALSTVVVGAVLGAGIGRVLPRPVADPTATPAPVAAATAPSESRTEEPVVLPTSIPTAAEPATPAPTKAAPTARPTTRPDPTKAPMGPLELALKGCPGGVVIDWSKPSPKVDHYRVLRSEAGAVPATYPADGTTEVETATSWSAGVTDGFDATIDGGATASYRAFAFDSANHVVAWSPSRTVSTTGRIELGALSVEAAGTGSIDAGWGPPEVSAGCFTYGKLVASTEDPDPSYLKGSPYIAVIGESGSTGTHVEGLESGTTVWMRYEIIRATSLGSFVVARTDVVQVTYP